MLSGAVASRAGAPCLSWDAPHYLTDGSSAGLVSTYRVYIGESSGVYTDSVLVTDRTHLFLDGISSAPIVYFAVAAVESGGVEGDLSDEVVWERALVAPSIAPGGGVFVDPVEITITTPTPGAAIHYTLDDSNPSSGSPVYSSPVTLTQSATVKAIAVKNGLDESAVTEASLIVATEGVDSDLDGQPDIWEFEHFSTASALPDADADGDGRSNLQEFIAGTDPVVGDPGPALQITRAGGLPTVDFPTRPAVGVGYQGMTRYYALEACDDPIAGTWAPVPGCEAIPGQGQNESHAPEIGGNFAWWRLRLWLTQP